jgi:NodT family efflux transporter outer membrane factor (OMF) lipoprotein
MSEALRSRSRTAPIALAVAASVALAGCTVGPNYKEPAVPVQTNFSTATTQPAAAATQPVVAVDPAEAWWTSFNDPTLNRLVDEAVRANLNLRAAEARIREARAQRSVAASGYYPSVDASGSYARQRVSKNGVLGVGGEGDLWQAGFDAAWEIDVFGGVRRSVEAANANIQAAVADRNDVLLTLLGEVARTYVELRGSQRQLAISQENATAQRQTLQLTQAKLRAGLTNDLDVARSEAQVSSTESTIPSFQTAVDQAIHAMSVLLGKPPAALLEELGPPAPIPAPPPEVPVGLPTELLRRRPDIRRAERQLAASVANIGVATADLFPRFTLDGSVGLQSTSFNRLGDSGSGYWSIIPGVRLPIFNAGRLRSNVAVQRARADQALANYEQTVLLALQEVEDALVAYQKEFTRRETLAAAVNANRRAVNLSTQLYQRGLTNFLDVLDAQRALYASEDELVRSDAQVSANAVALLKALGGGWNVPPAEEVAAR